MSDLRQPPEPHRAQKPEGDQPTPRDCAGPPESGSGGDAGPGRTSPVGRLAATVERLRQEVRAAQAEADGRALIELAKGILVERLGCGPTRAARQLAELTEQAGMTALEFAVEVINQASRDQLSEVATASSPPPRPGPRPPPHWEAHPPPYGCGRPRAVHWPPTTPRPSPMPCWNTP